MAQIKEEYKRGPMGNPPDVVHRAREDGEIPEIPTIPRPVEPLCPLMPNELRNLWEPSPSDIKYIPRRAIMMDVPKYHHQGYDMHNFQQKLADIAKLAVTLLAEFRSMRLDDLINLDIRTHNAEGWMTQSFLKTGLDTQTKKNWIRMQEKREGSHYRRGRAHQDD